MSIASPHYSRSSFVSSPLIRWTALSGCALFVFYITKFLGPAFTKVLYQMQATPLLDLLTGNRSEQPLDFYVGRAQETLWGPLSQLISGLFFAVLGLRVFRDWPASRFGLAVFAYLLLTKIEVLLFPPYGDAVGGPFAEAIWLARHSLSHVGLYQEAGYVYGGPKVYMFSIYPTYLAVLLKILPWSKVFLIVNHLLVFLMVAVITALLKDVLTRSFGAETAVLGALLLLYLPLFQSQTEAINMEMPCAFFVMLSAYFLILRRIHWAGLMAVMAVLVKGTGVIACAGILAVGAVMFFTDKERKYDYRLLAWGLGLGALAILKIYSKFLIDDQHVSQGMISYFKGWPSLYGAVITYIFFGGAVLLLVFYLRKQQEASAVEMIRAIRSRATVIMTVFGVMWFLLFLNFYAVSPRYKASLYPFLVYVVIAVVAVLFQKEGVRRRVLLAVLAVALFSSYGLFYKPIPENDHVILERSLEYRNDLQLHLRVVRRLQERYADFKIGAPFIFAQMLALPELGYVKEKMDVMIYGFQCRYGDIQDFPGIKELNIARTVYVGLKTAKLDENVSYPISEHDRVVEVLQNGNKKASLFMGGIAIDSVLRAARMYQLNTIFNQLKH